jgi:hypothetical protein
MSANVRKPTDGLSPIGQGSRDRLWSEAMTMRNAFKGGVSREIWSTRAQSSMAGSPSALACGVMLILGANIVVAISAWFAVGLFIN